jgi:hypothetical protein
VSVMSKTSVCVMHTFISIYFVECNWFRGMLKPVNIAQYMEVIYVFTKHFSSGFHTFTKYEC